MKSVYFKWLDTVWIYNPNTQKEKCVYKSFGEVNSGNWYDSRDGGPANHYLHKHQITDEEAFELML